MGFFKKQLLKVIEWSDMTSDTVVKRFDCPDRYAIMKGSRLVVRESQMAVLVNKGKFADVFEPGTYKLDDLANIPILSALANWVYAFETKWTAEVYFINTVQFLNQKWGTQNPVMLRDKDFGMIRIRAFGVYSFRAVDIKKCIEEFAGTRPLAKVDDVNEYLKRAIVSKLSDVIGESKIAALDFASQYDELSEFAQQKLQKHFEEFGLELSSFHIENISLPPEVEKTLDTRTSMGIMGDKMGSFTQYQAAQALRDAAQNTSGGIAGAGVGLGAGVSLGQVMGAALANTKDAAVEEKIVCPHCGKNVNKDTKFCPDCGKMVKNGCSKCGAILDSNVKFCPSCGNKVAKTCAKCDAELAANTKFCPSCGEKVD
ncbi:MAG TPA: SPFH domain-containing protein [Clostridia bacterium]|nr:SPFH domain-containing protein [Clostridia bacterium]